MWSHVVAKHGNDILILPNYKSKHVMQQYKHETAEYMGLSLKIISTI